MSFDLSEIFEEFAEATGGHREFIEAATRDVRRSRAQKLEDWGQTGLLASLKATKWNREHPERRREIANRYAAKPEVKARQLALAKKRRAAKPAEVLLCKECRRTFERARKGVAPEFCSDACRQRFRYQQRTPGARRIKRHSAEALISANVPRERQRRAA